MVKRNQGDLEIQRAMAVAIASWGGMLVLLLILLCLTVIVTWPVLDAEGAAGIDGWFVSAMVLVAVLPTLAAFVHRRIFHTRRAERGVVTPNGYLLASLIMWGGITISGIWAAFGALMANEFIPHVIPLLIATFLLLGTWPNGKAMVKPRSRESDDDTELFHIPPEDE
ncbi:MAG: hypothetical protein WD294_01850 [Phycisphaeraceae bacterium]